MISAFARSLSEFCIRHRVWAASIIFNHAADGSGAAKD